MRRSIVGIKRAFAAGLLYVACLQPQMQAQGGSTPAPADRAQLVPNGGYYALVIGINDYAPPLPKLATAVADARAIAQVLSDSYGFQVKLLVDQDATRNNILKAIAQYRNKLSENDNLLIYYAGHGFSDGRAEKAYWIPVDADSVDSPNRIIADEITTDVRVQSARHVLIISDSCYSGGLMRGADDLVPSAGQTALLNRMLKSRSRTLMSSGGDEPVADGGPDGHSVFAYALIRALQGTEQNVYTGIDLFYGYLRQRVAGNSTQVPQYVPIRDSGHDDGDFVFMRKKNAALTGTLSSSEASQLWVKGKALTDANQWAEALPFFRILCAGDDPRGCQSLGLAYFNGLAWRKIGPEAQNSSAKHATLKARWRATLWAIPMQTGSVSTRIWFVPLSSTANRATAASRSAVITSAFPMKTDWASKRTWFAPPSSTGKRATERKPMRVPILGSFIPLVLALPRIQQRLRGSTVSAAISTMREAATSWRSHTAQAPA
jgi:hypothetical protein